MSAVPEGLGSAAEEAARLAEALGGWFAAATAGPAAAQDVADPDAADPDAADPDAADRPHDPATCRACPLCRAVAAVRSVDPVVVEHLTSAAGSLAAALRELRSPSATRGPQDPA